LVNPTGRPSFFCEGMFALRHSESCHIEVENRLFFLALVCILLAQANDGANGLGVEALTFHLGIDILDVVPSPIRLLFSPDSRRELSGRRALNSAVAIPTTTSGSNVVNGRGRILHLRRLPPDMELLWLLRAPQVWPRAA